MKTPAATIVRALSLAAFALGLAFGASAGCEKKTASPDDGQKQEESTNLCTEYNTCDQCIAGQQAKGLSRGTAETECGAAVLGCWTTWDKPITCAGKEHKREEPAD